MNKIIKSLAIIAFVAAIAVGATTAYFSDVETSTGNTFTAGAIDLTVDSEQHYNGNVCIKNEAGAQPPYIWSGNAAYPQQGTACSGTWEATDLGAQTKQFFNFSDVKPGDSGENTISLHIDNNDAWVRLVIKDVADLDNSCTEPEQGSTEGSLTEGCTVAVPEGTLAGAGELRENLVFSMWLDQGVIPGFQGKDKDDGEGDNVRQDQYEPELISAGTIDIGGETWTLPTPLAGNSTAYFGVAWNLPSSVGNIVQTDSLNATMEFQVEQARNNPVGFDNN